MEPQNVSILMEFLNYAWVVLFMVAGWGIKKLIGVDMRMSITEQELIRIHEQRAEDEKRRVTQRREIMDNQRDINRKLDRLVEKLLTD